MLQLKSKLLNVWVFIILIGTGLPKLLCAQTLPIHQLDSIATKAMDVFNVPGMSVSIVKDGKVVLAKGYGISSIVSKQKTDENTLFGIASNSKAFTSAALGILVNDGKLQWDDKVTKYIPEFKMYDQYVTDNFTVRDLLTHRSGLGTGAGDLLHNPDSTSFTIVDVINSLHYLKPVASFRSRYAYDNILYLVAGELINRVSGMSWGDFVEKRIMAPLKMDRSGASYTRVKSRPNVIDGHREVNGKLETISRTNEENDAGAGGIYASAADMAKWMLMQLNSGKYGPAPQERLFSESIHRDMWTPQIVIPVGRPGAYSTHFGAYGLGWFLVDAKGYLEVFHTGQDDGMISEVILFPELKLGITVLSNQEGGGAVRAVTDYITDMYLGIPGTDHIKEYQERIKANSTGADTVKQKVWQTVILNQKNSNIKIDSTVYTGTYHDNWFGDVRVYKNKGKLWFQSKKSLQLKGSLLFYSKNTFVVKWNNPQIDADAFVTFQLGKDGRAAGMTIKGVSPQISPAYDFQDLDFRRVN